MDTDRTEGKLKEVSGSMKDRAGEWTGDRELEAEGEAEHTEGKAQGAMGKAKNAASDAMNSVKDKLGR